MNVQKPIKTEALAAFLREARTNCSYEVAGDGMIKKLPDGSEQVGPYTKKELSYIDKYRTYEGDTRFDGREVILHSGIELWMRVYEGRITDEKYKKDGEPGRIYALMRSAMRKYPKDLPFRRGQNELKKDGYLYTDVCTGTMEQFDGTETISHNGNTIYLFHYHGGLIKPR